MRRPILKWPPIWSFNNVTFLGKVSDEALQTALSESHVLVLPSRTKAEAFGLVLLEAMAAGCVPIASNLPGVRDVVTGQVGFTFPVDDSDTLGALLSYLHKHPEIVKRYATQAQAKAGQYRWQRSVEAHDRLFRQLIINEQVVDEKEDVHDASNSADKYASTVENIEHYTYRVTA